MDGLPAATVPIANLESYDLFALTNATVNLTAGEHQLRLALSGYFNLDYIEFVALQTVLRLPGAAPILATSTEMDGTRTSNGNGRKDFGDVVLYFNQMAWIGSNEPIAAFDTTPTGGATLPMSRASLRAL